MARWKSPSKSRIKGPFVVTLTLIAGACGGQTNRDGSSANGNCPASTPGIGTACAGTVECSYDQCATSGSYPTLRCDGSAWQMAGIGSCGNPPPPPRSTCPDGLPSSGSACLVDGITCSYGDDGCCPGDTATCIGGSWQVSVIDCNPPAPACPETPPQDGSSCASSDPCAYPYQVCGYGICGDLPETEASCDGNVWQVTKNACKPSCETLDACGCFARDDCQPVSDGCLCECDFACPTAPLCMCACGGGTFLGCKPSETGGAP